MSADTRRERLRPGLLAGATAALVATLVLELLRLGPGVPLPLDLASDRFIPLVPVDVFLKLLGLTGGFLIAKQLAFFSSLLGQVLAGALLGALYGRVVERGRGSARRDGLLLAGAAVVAWGISLTLLWPVLGSSYEGQPPGRARLLSAASLLLLLVLYVVFLVALYSVLSGRRPSRAEAGLTPASGDRGVRRRTVVVGAAGGLVALASGGLAAVLYRRSTFGYDGLKNTGPNLPPITPNDRFYVVTKNFVDPRVDRDVWRLRVHGLVEEPRTYTFAELSELPSVEQETTLECISNKVGGGLMSNAVWKGVPLQRLLTSSRPRPGVTRVFLRAADGYTYATSFDRARNESTLVAYGMNGERLPDRHGYPVRLIMPGGYGELNVKWLQEVELVDEAVQGYYEKQGYRAEYVHTTSRIDQPTEDQSIPAGAPIPVRGVAFAGDRGVARVEVSADGGRTWRRARIDYRGSRLTWVLWSLVWRPERSGTYTLLVRATDGAGKLQTAKVDDVAPDGATGYHRIRAHVRV